MIKVSVLSAGFVVRYPSLLSFSSILPLHMNLHESCLMTCMRVSGVNVEYMITFVEDTATILGNTGPRQDCRAIRTVSGA
jgi:hypothetical protein